VRIGAIFAPLEVVINTDVNRNLPALANSVPFSGVEPRRPRVLVIKF
jgi:hypothetical protein